MTGKTDAVLKIIADQSTVSSSGIKVEDTLASIGINSLKMVELIVTLEDELIIVFDDSELDASKLITVDDVVKMVKKYTGDKGLSLCGNS